MLYFSTNVVAQDFKPDLSQWSLITRLKAKSSFRLFVPKESRQVIFYCNLARMNGELFVRTIVEPYLQAKNDTAFSEYKQSLVNDLNSLPKLKPLRSSKALTAMAKSYAISSGKKGVVGHTNFDKRFASLLRSGKAIGENLAYHQDTPLDVVIDLLIDEGIFDYGHRRNILSPTFIKVGVFAAQHRDYDNVWVMEFSGQ